MVRASLDVRFLAILAIEAYRNLLFLRILLSWLPMFQIRLPDALRPAVNFLYDLTEPFLRLFRGLLPPLGGFDLSPLLAFVVLSIVREVVAQILF